MSETKAPRRKARARRAGVTMADVAAEAGVSMQTVSRALREPRTVAPETLELITAAIRKTHYVHNLAASVLASSRSMTVAAIIPTLSTSVFAETIQSLSDVVVAKGYQLFVGNTDYRLDREEDLIRSLLGRRPDGLFIVGTRHTRGAVSLMKRAGIPVVEGWDLSRRPIDRQIGFSNTDAMDAIVRHLAETGRRRLVFAGVLRAGDSRARMRRDGFVAASERIWPDETPRLVDCSDLALTMEDGGAVLERVEREHPDADAIVLSSDITAAGVLLAAMRRGIAVPGRFAITGFGDFEFARHIIPSLTTIAVPTRRIGAEAGRLLLDLMSDAAGTRREDGPKTIDVGFELIVRESG
ncbi:LacI family gluconate utilization system Gnt-I transcriptional repressor [Kaistia hirudinis]|uniref:LacI family gluconate utilization system Gnt-I transcriptional repressor n=1 Tax=Kaistia hirudinis TaxID=1293440 RepID=A0A840AIK2_9HYPH|nr:LacI family gluconate utilization system Gnt-I transcriptional repressor [Kaistia hirudinis]